ncbi:MAG TPA: histidine triad nucleotide-binding protein [Ruminococcaceae bacterium]|nr:histidine triad nucleotide-binding protein [Oscillospiraceae bacterium]
MGCIFCGIISGDIPSQKIYETETVLAFKDIDPKAPFHAVIIPKAHIKSAMEITGENSPVIAEIFEAAAKIATDENLAGGFRLVNNCGADGGQTVDHFHIHMLAGRVLAWPPG